MNVAKGVLLVVGSYVVAMAAAVILILLTVAAVSGQHNCHAMGQALLGLWAMLVVLLVLSMVVVWRISGRVAITGRGRATVVAALGVLLLPTFAVMAFGLMIAFNC